ncbi:MAG: FHA domain-containing protein [Phycisphaeraceae bacterium]|jgi:pSer/pThr/pTyr-binding forkhead associated (FHA) protein|nr:FHA domain-containing protein [Phycisphaeraceae bacterium]
MVILIVVKGPDQGKVFHIDGDGPIRIGRALDLKLKDQKVSHNHLEIMRDNGDWFVQDQGSRTGTLLNGEKIESRMALTNGATLRLGPTTLVFAVVPESAQVASQPHASSAGSSVIAMVDPVDEHATGDAAGNVAAEWSQNDAKVQRLLESVIDRLDRLPPPPNYDDELAEIRAVLSTLQQPAPQSDGRLRQKIADLATRFETVAAAAVSPPQYDDEFAQVRDAIAKVQSDLAGDHTVDDEQRGLLTRIIDRLESLHSLALEPSEVPAPPDFTQVIDALRQIVRESTDTQSAPLLAQPALAAQGDVHELRQVTAQMRDELAQLEKSRNVAQQVLVEKFQEAETQSQKQLSEVLDEVRAAAQADQARDELIEKLFAAMRFVQMQQQRLEQMVQPAGAESSPEPASPAPLPKTAALAQAKHKPANASPILTKPAMRVAPPADRSQSSPPAAAPIARSAPQPVRQAPVPLPIEELATTDVGDDGQVILPVQEGVRNRPFTANMSAKQISISAVIALFVLIAAFWFGKTTGFTTDLLETSEQATEPLDQPDDSALRDLERTDAKTGSSQPTLGDLRLATEEQR